MLGILAFAAASCEKDLDPSFPQENPQGPIVSVNDVVTSAAGVFAGPSNTLTLEDYNTLGSQILVLNAPATTNLPENATVTYQVEFSDTETFDRSKTLSAPRGETADTENGYYIMAEDWNSVHLYLFGKSPKVKKIYYRVIGYVDLDDSNYIIGDKTNPYVLSGSLEETCFDQGFTISDAYYFLGNATTWTPGDATPYKFNRNEEVSPYDDPIFTYNFQVSQDVIDANGGGCYWKIAPKEAVENNNWDGVVGTEVDGDDSLEGFLVQNNPQAGKLTQAGLYKLTINMEEMTYNFEQLSEPEFLYTPGGTNGWNQKNSAWMQLYTKYENDVVVDKYYYALTEIDGEGFKVCMADKWADATDYGSKTGDEALSGELMVGGGAKNITVPAEDQGLCWLRVDYDPLTLVLTKYEVTPITRVGVIGSFVGSGWGSDVEMTSEDNVNWTAEVTFAAGDQFKIRFNGDWAINLGGSMTGLTFDSGNLVAEEAGTFTVTLTIQPGVPTIHLTKK